MSAASDAMGDRLRPLLPPGLVEKKMFGGIGFMLHGNMTIGTTAKGELLVRIDPARQAEALAMPGAHQMRMGARPMTGFVAVEASGTPDDAALRRDELRAPSSGRALRAADAVNIADALRVADEMARVPMTSPPGARSGAAAIPHSPNRAATSSLLSSWGIRGSAM